jgi:hypothetical protein
MNASIMGSMIRAARQRRVLRPGVERVGLSDGTICRWRRRRQPHEAKRINGSSVEDIRR